MTSSSPDPESPEDHLLRSWTTNAGAWTSAVRQHRIASRERVTNAAIVRAVLACAGSRVLDIGCGEGWLARELSAQGRQVTGIDAVEDLVARARQLNAGASPRVEFRCMDYAALTKASFPAPFDIAVCNFSLLGDASVAGVLACLPRLLVAGGCCVVQTLHPLVAGRDQPYVDSWRRGSWDGFDATFTDPPPWYFRTLSTWLILLRDSGLLLCELQEPLDPLTGQPASVIFVCSTAAR